MTDFDARLRSRLERLDSAVPGMAPPALGRFAKRAPNRRRQGVMLAAAALLTLAATALAATASQPPPDPAVVARDQADEVRLRNDLGSFTETACLSPAQATTLVRERLDALGLGTWTIRDDGRYRDAPCVGMAPIGDSHEVLMLPSMGGNVSAALDVLSADLMGVCASRAEAADMLSSTLADNGVANPNIEFGAIQSIPLEFGDRYVDHFNNGCVVYGGAQFDATGRYTWYLAAR